MNGTIFRGNRFLEFGGKEVGGRVGTDGVVEIHAHSRALALALSPRGDRELWGSGHNDWMSPWGVLGFLDLPTILSFMG